MDKEAKENVARGFGCSDRCQFCHEFGEKIEPYLCPDCAIRIKKLGYHKALDSPELKKKIKDVLFLAHEDGTHTGETKENVEDETEEIISHISEELIKEGRREVMEWVRNHWLDIQRGHARYTPTGKPNVRSGR